jgi:hypothetical protein
MRLLFPVTIAIAVSATAQPAIVAAPSVVRPNALQTSDCPSPSSEYAREGSMWRQKPVKPQKLAELPPADAFAAVYHLDERGCMVPVRYREIRR